MASPKGKWNVDAILSPSRTSSEILLLVWILIPVYLYFNLNGLFVSQLILYDIDCISMSIAGILKQ